MRNTMKSLTAVFGVQLKNGILAASLLFTSLGAQAAPIDQADGKPDLFEVSDGDSSIFVYGTFHLLPDGLEWKKEKVIAKLKSAEKVFFELDLDAPDFAQQAQTAMQLRMFAPLGSSLKASLGDEKFEQMTTILGAMGLPPAAIDRMQPAIAGLLLGQALIAEAGFDPNSGVELQLVAVTKEAGIDAEGLESAADQIAALTDGSYEEQIANLSKALDEIDQMQPQLQTMLNAWMADDFDSLIELFEGEDADPGVARALLEKRNNNWMPTLESLLADNSNAFIAVGAGHLWGQFGILTQLEAKGFKITRH